MKKILIIIGIIVIALGVSKVKAFQSYFQTYKSSSATTTVTFMTGGTATTTYPLSNEQYVYNSDVDYNDLFVLFTASTTNSQLNWTYQGANIPADGSNCVSSPTKCDWYDYDSIINTSNEITHASSTSVNSWKPANTLASSSGKMLRIPQISAYYKRVVFTIPIGTNTGGSLWTMDNAVRLPTNK